MNNCSKLMNNCSQLMNNFPDCMKSIEKMDAQSNTFTATEPCFCLSVSFLYTPYSYLTEN